MFYEDSNDTLTLKQQLHADLNYLGEFRLVRLTSQVKFKIELKAATTKTRKAEDRED